MNDAADSDAQGVTDSDAQGAADPDAYGGLPGAFPYAFRRSSSRLFSLYAVIGTLAGLAVAFVFALALIVLIAATASAGGGSLTLSRAFFVLVGLFVVVPIVAPILLVARRYRRGAGDDGRYDRRLALAGFAFLCSLYVALVATAPPAQQNVPAGSVALGSVEAFGVGLEPTIPAVVVDGGVAPAVEALYALPAVLGLVPPVLAGAAIYVVHRRSR